MEFKNESGLVFTNICSEEFREYHFPKGESIRINNPTHLNVSASGGHRVFSSENGMSYYIPKGWILLAWKAKEGCPNFVK